MTTAQRLDLLTRAYPRLFPRTELVRLLREQLGGVDAIEQGRVRAPRMIYHICAGNLAVSAWTSLMYGLLLGAHNVVKLPSDRADATTRQEILAFIHGLPASLRRLVKTHRELDHETLIQADAVIAFGSDATMAELRAKLRWDQKFLAHGHAVSFLWVAHPDQLITVQARACAIDVLTYDQLGCLSPQAIYVPVRTDMEALGNQLAEALEWGSRRPPGNGLADFRTRRNGTRPRPVPGGYGLPKRPLGTAARIAEARDMAYALGHRVWHPPHLGWTVIHDPEPEFQPSPLHGVIYLRAVAESRLRSALAPVAGKISTIGVVGMLAPALRKIFTDLGATRFCRAGRMQFPPLTWHHDGRAPLADLVTWIDVENVT